MCKSKYVALFADDDLYICSSISKGIDFLNKNEKYVCWGGKIILFGASNKYDTINSIPYNFSEMYSGREINFKSTYLEKRIFFYIKNPNAVIFHHMFRREALLYVYKKVLKSDLRIPNMIDLYANSLSCCSGLVKTGNDIIRMKQYHAASDAKSRDINNTISNPKFLGENKEYIKQITNYICDKKKMSKFSLKKKLAKKLKSHFESASLLQNYKSENIKKKTFIFNLKNILLNKRVNKFYYPFKKNYAIYKFINFMNKIENKKIKKEIFLILKFFKSRQL